MTKFRDDLDINEFSYGLSKFFTGKHQFSQNAKAVQTEIVSWNAAELSQDRKNAISEVVKILDQYIRGEHESLNEVVYIVLTLPFCKDLVQFLMREVPNGLCVEGKDVDML